MNKTMRYVTCLGLVLLTATAAEATQRRNPLDGQPAIRNRYEMRSGRFELGPSFMVTLNRAYRHSLLFGAKMQYHFSDYFSLGADMGYGFGLDTGLSNEIKATYDAEDPSSWAPISRRFADIKFAGDIRFAFTPLTGKLAFFGKLFVYYDLYAFAGVALAMTQNKGSSPEDFGFTGEAAQYHDIDAANEGFRAGPAFGFGMHIFFNEWFALGFEAKNLIFFDNETGGDVTRGLSEREKQDNFRIMVDKDDKVFSQHWFLGINLTFFLPPRADISP